MDVPQYDTVLNSQYQQKSRKRKEVSVDTPRDKKVVTSSSKTSISTGEALSQMTSEMEKRRKMVSKSEQAIALLYSDYEKRLDLDSFVKAINLVENDSKASILLTLKSGDIRDRWLELHLATEVELLN